MRDLSEYHSLHTGDEQGFSWAPCCRCHSTLGGDRFELWGLKKAPARSGMTPELIGNCCLDCHDSVNM